MFEASDLNNRNRKVERLWGLLFLMMTILLILPVLVILGVLIHEGGPILSMDFLFTEPKDGMTAGGIFPASGGNGMVGHRGAAGFGTRRCRRRPVLERVRPGQLADSRHQSGHHQSGRSSFYRPRPLRSGAFVLFFKFGTSILAASLTLAVMTLPVVIVATRESLQAVPQAFREACWNMGATRWQTIRHVVLPNSVSGILTGVILEVSRTAGETAPIMFTGAAFFLPFLPQSVFDQTMAMSLHLFVISTQVPGVPEALPFGVALVLICMVLAMNAISIAFRTYLRGKKKW